MKVTPRKPANAERNKSYNTVISSAAANGNVGDEVFRVVIVQALRAYRFALLAVGVIKRLHITHQIAHLCPAIDLLIEK